MIVQVSLENIFHITNDAQVGRIVLTYIKQFAQTSDKTRLGALIKRTTRQMHAGKKKRTRAGIPRARILNMDLARWVMES